MAEVTMVWRYVGDGAFLPGVPARDLTALEAGMYARRIQAALQAGQVLYAPVALTNSAASEAADEAPRAKRKGKATDNLEAVEE